MSVFKKMRGKAREEPYCTAVLVAAGSSRRMGGADKLFLDLCGRPVIVWSIEALERSDCIHEIVVVARSERIAQLADLCREYGFSKVKRIVRGGETRTDSALAGLSEMDRRTEVAAIHDAARPLVPPEVIREVVLCGAKNLAAAPAVPVKDTIKQAENSVVTHTPDRGKLVAVQTPQAFQADLIKGALTRAVAGAVSHTDDCAAVEAMGVQVHLTPGSEENIKLTTPVDFKLAAAILQERGDAF